MHFVIRRGEWHGAVCVSLMSGMRLEARLTQQGRVPVPQGKALVAGHAERRQHVEALLQQGLQARG